jgi:trehalose/maltose transport system permease protein
MVAGRRLVGGPHRRRVRAAWLFLLPTLLVLAVVAAWPLGRTILLGFTDAELGDLAGGNWVGLDNFRRLATDPDWWHAVRTTLLFAAVSVSLELALGMVIALVLDVSFFGRGAVRAAVLVPWAVPTVVSAQMWRWMYNDTFGVVNDLLLRLGLIDRPVAWLADDRTALAAVIATDVWKATPFMALLLLAGLQTIPAELYQAASVDGAGAVRRFLSVTLPLLRPAIAVALIFRTLDALRAFDLIYVMTSNARGTATMAVYARQQLIDFQDAGYGSAVSCVVFVIIGLVSVLYIALLRPGFAARSEA